ncbi:hypothetical protein [Fodinicola feengrottensis]|uniref:Nucleotidyltransferase domain-containing protein n=1 Tax=Fodinicola feengrottensis TaxID=435914 RepID=A0ABP4TD42_9ACTN|nr:hypothetical protein [Fodinicola feengrottensis]
MLSFADLMRRAEADPAVVGAVLSGSKARDGMATEHSDYDVYLIIADGVEPGWQPVRTPELDLDWMSLSAFRRYALPGEPEDWDRYAFVHAKILIDRADIAAIVHRKARLTSKEAHNLTAGALDAYINSAYRAAKNRRDGRTLAAHLDAADSIAHLLTVIFALHRRVRPFNKFLEWELRRHPLAAPRWSADNLLPRLENIVRNEDAPAQQSLFDEIEAATRTEFAKVLDGWDEDGGESDLTLLRSHGTVEAS